MAAARKGLRFDERIAGLSDLLRARAETGLGKVPVIEAPGGWVTDSTNILAWLEDQAPEPSLYPRAPRDRAECELLEDWADEALAAAAEPWLWVGEGRLSRIAGVCAAEQLRWSDRWLMRAMLPEMHRRWKARAKRHGGPEGTRAQLRRQLALVEQRLAGAQWLFGDAPSAADFAIAGQLLNFVRFGCSGDLDAHPATAAMVRRAGALLGELS